MLFSQTLASMAGRTDGEPGFIAEIGPDWSQGRASFGGIVAALGNEAMRRIVSAERPLRALDVTFVGPALAGRVYLQSEILRIGKAVTIAHSRLLSDGKIAATLTGVYGAARSSVLKIAPQPAMPAPPVEDSAIPAVPPGAHGPHFVQHFDLRWAEGSVRPFAGSQMSSSKAYIRHRDTSALTESHVVALIDCIWSPALQMLKTMAPSSSLTWRLEFIRHDYSFPPEAWWRIDSQSNAAAEGYISQSAVVLDPNGTQAAFSHQLVAVFG